MGRAGHAWRRAGNAVPHGDLAARGSQSMTARAVESRVAIALAVTGPVVSAAQPMGFPVFYGRRCAIANPFLGRLLHSFRIQRKGPRLFVAPPSLGLL